VLRASPVFAVVPLPAPVRALLPARSPLLLQAQVQALLLVLQVVQLVVARHAHRLRAREGWKHL
jgi:hypothetical protein